MEKPALNKGKLEAAVHLARIDRPSDLGAVKLHKVLWFSDLELMHTTGQTLCGETFIKMPQGPWGTHVDKIIKHLVHSEAIAEGEGSYHGYKQRQFFSHRRPDIHLFSAEEISVIDRMIEIICFGHTAKSISQVTHDRVWNETKEHGVMPATCVFEYLIDAPTNEEIKSASRPLDRETEDALAEIGLA